MARLARLLLLPAVLLLLLGSAWWADQQRYPVTRPAAALVLSQADLPEGFLPEEQAEIAANPYDDYTAHYRSGYRAVFAGQSGSAWQGSRLISTSFVVDRKGAASVFNAYVAQTQHRGERLPLPPLGEESLFLLARGEPSAPVVVIGAVRVQNVLITLTLLTDREVDPLLIHGWAERLVERAGTSPVTN